MLKSMLFTNGSPSMVSENRQSYQVLQLVSVLQYVAVNRPMI